MNSTLMNAVPRFVLRSPAHRLLSGRYCLLEFVGRTSGTAYVLPVAYVQRGGELFLSTDSRWWRNLVAGREFTVRLRGERRRATAFRVTGHSARAALAELVTIRGYAKAAGLTTVGGVIPSSELERAAAERVLLRVTILESADPQ